MNSKNDLEKVSLLDIFSKLIESLNKKDQYMPQNSDRTRRKPLLNWNVDQNVVEVDAGIYSYDITHKKEPLSITAFIQDSVTAKVIEEAAYRDYRATIRAKLE